MKAKKPHKKLHGEDYLSDIVSLTIKLENGEEASFEIAKELKIPDDPVALLRTAKKAPARLAFWAYQETRALDAVRRLEMQLARKEGEMHLSARKHLERDPDLDYSFVSNEMVKGAVSMQTDVQLLSAKLNTARKHYGVLRGVRSALEHVCWITRTLAAQQGDVKRGL